MRTSLAIFLLGFCSALLAQSVSVSGKVGVRSRDGRALDSSGVVVSLTPAHAGTAQQLPTRVHRLTQKNKRFSPHLLVVTLGSSVEFPNHDPFFHNVFSVYEGTRFDLGLYESGTSRVVKFTRPGPSYIFCNIHPEMSAVILALPTPYFAVTNASGNIAIADVPAGEYDLRIWYERSTPEELHKLGRRIRVLPEGIALPAIHIVSAPSLADGHKDKYGQDYRTEGYTVP